MYKSIARKPPFGTPIDWNKPMSSGLRCAVIANEGGGNKLYPSVWKADTQFIGDIMGNAVWDIGPNGPVVKLLSASEQYIKLGYWPGFSDEYTIVIGASSVLDSNSCLAAAAAVGDGKKAWQIFGFSPRGIQAYVWSGDTESYQNTYVTGNTTDYYQIILTVKPGRFEYFYNGKYIDYQTYSGSPDTDKSALGIGCRMWTSWSLADKYTNVNFNYLYFYDRWFNRDNAPQMFATPFGMYKSDFYYPFGATAGAAYSLAVDPGTLTFAGTSTGTYFNRKVDAGPGTLTLSGTAAGTYYNRLLTASPGTITLSGTAAGTFLGRLLDADPGTITLSGTAAGLFLGRMIEAGAGTITVNGTAVNLYADRIISVEPGTITFVGTDATLTYGTGYILQAESGTILLTGTDVSFPRNYVIQANSGTFRIVGQEVILQASGKYYKLYYIMKL